MNHWVGIVSLRETAAPTPVHRIALAIEAARRRTSYRLGGRPVSYQGMRAALRRLAQLYAACSDWGRSSYCVDLASDFFDGGGPLGALPNWLHDALIAELDGLPHSPGDRTRHSAGDRARFQDGAGVTSKRRYPADGLLARQARTPARWAAAELQQPYVRVARQLTIRDVPSPVFEQPPATLVGTFGQTVRSAIRDLVEGWEAGEQTTAWLGLAAMHRSRLYESGLSETAITPHVLNMLDQLGRSTIDVILIDAWVAQRQPEKVGIQSSEHHRRSTEARRLLGQWAAEHGLVCMGAGEAQRPAPSVAEGVARQILGVLSVTGFHDTARRLVQAVCVGLDHSSDDLGAVDPMTEAQRIFGKEALVYEFTQEGPDHDRTYTATVTAGGGRRARGTGPSKKAARAAAVRALLRGLPRGARPAGSPTRRQTTAPPQPYRDAPVGHRDALEDLAAMFELDTRPSAGLLAQALTHVSYTYENHDSAVAHHQRDNQLLAHQGSLVLDYFAKHARVSRVLAHGLIPDEDEARMHTPANEDTARLGITLALGEAIRTGRGEDSHRRSTVADAAQSVAAAAWRRHGTQLLSRRPAVLDDWLSELSFQHDPVTVLNYLTAMFGMSHHYEHRRTGPDHSQTFASTVVLSDACGRNYRWTTSPPGEPCSKGDADQATAQNLLEILATPADGLIDALTSAERDLLRYLLRAQLDGLATMTLRQRTRMVSGGLLGADLLATGDLDAFRTWARQVEELLHVEDASVPLQLSALYRQILADTRFGPRSLLRRMAAEQGNDPGATIRRHAADAVERAVTRTPLETAVRDVVQSWWRHQATRTSVTVRDDLREESFLPLTVQLAALGETLTWCGQAAEAAGSPIDVELTVHDGTLHTWIGLHVLDARETCEDFAWLLARTLPCTDCVVEDDHVLLRLHSQPDAESVAPLAAAGIAAYLADGRARSVAANVPRDELVVEEGAS